LVEVNQQIPNRDEAPLRPTDCGGDFTSLTVAILRGPCGRNLVADPNQLILFNL